ncbi:cytolytic toxin-alpha isoform X2 [Astyanax mexicanus]|uniref:cytolytic toxin-alpha isoform X2 n=1 Tax=Astyanax mexicanus TaxID=7994 RepID=UPI0020CAF72B|nr:cytolytic toxin-alpha isoform X2 [Astyanax mexicanus]
MKSVSLDFTCSSISNGTDSIDSRLRPVSPAPSFMSLNSNQSMNHPIAFSDGSNAGHSRPRSECPSMKSEQSMNHPVAFSDGSGSRSRDMKQRLCNIHNRPLDILCKTDQDFICLICMMEEHKTDNERADGELSYLLKYVSRVPEKDNSLTFVEVAALGRPLHVGTLYDCRNDSFFSDDALWDVDTVSSSKVSLSQPHTDVRILEGDSLQDRLESLDLTTALRASVVSGLVNVMKAAAFLEHPAQSQLQDRITLHYRTSTRLELLGHRLLHSGAPLLVTNQNSATHVVVAVLYGGQSFFVFDKESDSSEGVQELKAAVSKMITCSNAAELLSEETSFASCKCSVYTDAEDFTLVDFKTAVTLYSCHQKLLGPQGEEGGPLKVWLYPLKNLKQTPAFVPQEISEDLLHKAENVLNHLEYLKADQGICLDTMSSFSNLFGITWIVALKNTLSKFSLLLKQYQRAFQRGLASCIKTIREKGEEGQENLRDLLRRNTQSPFSPQNLNQWLRNKEAEVRALNECRSANITIIKTQDDLKRVIEDSQAGGVLCFALTSLEGEDQFLSALKQHIHLLIMDNTQAAQAPFRLPDVSQKILSDLCSFLFTREVEEHAEKTKFIAACLPNERFPGSSIYLYQSGKVVSQNLKVDIKPAPVEIITVKQTCVTLKLQSLKMAFADRYRLEYKAVSCRGTTGTEPKWKAIEIWRTGSNVVVLGVNPGTHYQLRHAIMNSDSMSDYSRITEFQTLARARPGQPTVMKQKTLSLFPGAARKVMLTLLCSATWWSIAKLVWRVGSQF